MYQLNWNLASRETNLPDLKPKILPRSTRRRSGKIGKDFGGGRGGDTHLLETFFDRRLSLGIINC